MGAFPGAAGAAPARAPPGAPGLRRRSSRRRRRAPRSWTPARARRRRGDLAGGQHRDAACRLRDDRPRLARRLSGLLGGWREVQCRSGERRRPVGGGRRRGDGSGPGRGGHRGGRRDHRRGHGGVDRLAAEGGPPVAAGPGRFDQACRGFLEGKRRIGVGGEAGRRHVRAWRFGPVPGVVSGVVPGAELGGRAGAQAQRVFVPPPAASGRAALSGAGGRLGRARRPGGERRRGERVQRGPRRRVARGRRRAAVPRRRAGPVDRSPTPPTGSVQRGDGHGVSPWQILTPVRAAERGSGRHDPALAVTGARGELSAGGEPGPTRRAARLRCCRAAI